MKVLVTGAAGYIGSTLLEYLLGAGHEVTAVDNYMFDNANSLASYVHHPKLNTVCADLTQPFDLEWLDGALPWADVVIPLAALVGAPLCDKREVEATKINLEQIERIVGNLQPHQKIIYPNTNSGYGIKEGICYEDDPMNPISHYGRTKCDAEKVALSHKNSVVLRLATVFGPSPRMRYDLMVNYFFYEYFHTGELRIFEPHFRRNFVHVRDVARGFMFSLDKNVQGVFNLGNDDLNCTKWELAVGIQNWIQGFTVDPYSETFRVYEEAGEDPDKRDYNVSSQKIRDAGFSFKYNFDNGFPQLERLAEGTSPTQFKQWRNY